MNNKSQRVVVFSLKNNKQYWGDPLLKVSLNSVIPSFLKIFDQLSNIQLKLTTPLWRDLKSQILKKILILMNTKKIYSKNKFSNSFLWKFKSFSKIRLQINKHKWTFLLRILSRKSTPSTRASIVKTMSFSKNLKQTKYSFTWWSTISNIQLSPYNSNLKMSSINLNLT